MLNLKPLEMLSRYSLTHVITVDSGPVKTICSTGFFFRLSALKAMKKISSQIKDAGAGNTYYVSEQSKEGTSGIVVHDTKHYLTIQKL